MNLKNAALFLKKNNVFWILGVVALLGLVYWRWFVPGELLGGDLPYFYREFLRGVRLPAPLWSTYRGIGGGITPLLGLDTLQALSIVFFVQLLHLPWVIVYKIGWFGLFVIFSIYSSHYLLRTVLPEQSAFSRWLGVLIFTTNTYILMITGGGQMWIALAYALSPFVFARLILLSGPDKIPRNRMLDSVLSGALLAILLFLDLRIAYVALIGSFLFVLVKIMRGEESVSTLIFFFTSLGIGLAINAFWIIPMVFVGSSVLTQYGSAYTSVSALHFFSVADFSHAASLLHPNWPENIFGKVYFLQPEFLILPLAAYGSLLFLKRSKSSLATAIAAFALIGLAGTFFAKGSNEPFGSVSVWLFEHIPGFVMFRDSTKFYFLIVVSYCVLIPFTIENIFQQLHAKFRAYANVFLVAPFLTFLIFWSITIRQAIAGGLGGTFARTTVPEEYMKVEKFISGQPTFFRTVWIPTMTRLSFVSDIHPAIAGDSLFMATSSAEFAGRFAQPEAQQRLSALAVKYVMLPSDATAELFLRDRTYDPHPRAQFEKMLDHIPYLTKISSGPISIYETSSYRDHITLSTGEKVDYRMVTPALYQVAFSTSRDSTLYFSEQYHPGWEFRAGKVLIPSARTVEGLNSFNIPMGIYVGDISFSSQRYAEWGLWITGGVLIFLLGFCVVQFGNRKAL